MRRCVAFITASTLAGSPSFDFLDSDFRLVISVFLHFSGDMSDNLSKFLQDLHCGAMVQRLARGPFKAEIRVRFPLALPMTSTGWM
jgi:hypothetical protein